jgi:outer membrane receptor protein involved in Fe transport
VDWRTRYDDEQFANSENNVVLQSRSITDLRFGLQTATWDAQLYVKNLFDDDTIPSAGQTGPDLPNSEFRAGFRTFIPPAVLASPKIPRLTFANLPPPRQVGVQLRFRFGS